MMTNIYHYCSVNTFLSIVQYKKFWLSDSSHMNDEYEIIWIEKIVLRIIEDLKKEVEKLEVERLKKLKTEFLKIPYKKHYISCFSKEKDILSQWRGYADDGYGVSIGFSIENMFQTQKIPNKGQGVYQAIDKEPTATTHILGYEFIGYDFNKMIKDEIQKSIKDESTISMTALSLKELCTTLKNPSFHEEQEIRITYTPENPKQESYNAFIDKALDKISEKKFRVSDNNIIQYFELDFSENSKHIINEIVLGPKCKLDKKDLECFLKENGFEDVNITSSESSYR